MQKVINHLKDHTIVCGYGRMGRAVIQSLTEDQADIVVIEENDEVRLILNDAGVPFIIGDAADEEVLAKAHIDTAAALVAGTGSDAVNVYITLTARSMRPDLKIVARYNQENARAKLLKAGADQVISPYHASAQQATHILRRPAIVNVMEMAAGPDRQVRFEEIKVMPESKLCGRSLAELAIRANYGATVIGLSRPDGLLLNPELDQALDKDDVLIVMGDAADVDRLAVDAGTSSS